MRRARWDALLVACLGLCLVGGDCSDAIVAWWGAPSSPPQPGWLAVANESAAAALIYDNGGYLGTAPAQAGWKWQLAIGNHLIASNTSTAAIPFRVTDGERLHVVVAASGELVPR